MTRRDVAKSEISDKIRLGVKALRTRPNEIWPVFLLMQLSGSVVMHCQRPVPLNTEIMRSQSVPAGSEA